jgi:Domain of unknown function (DUF222)/HNH endonuclease
MPDELESLPLERLESQIGELAAHIHAATCRWLLLVGEFERREGWKPWGCKSCAHWLSVRCGVAIGAGREQVRVARRLAELPLVREAFARGELSYSKVRAISRVASEKTEPDLLELARHATASQLERIVRGYRGVVSTQIEQANTTYANRHVTWEWDHDGSLVFRGRLPAEDGALLVKALEAARDELRVSAETREAEDAPANAQDLEDVSAETSGLAAGDEDAPPADPRAPSNADAIVAIAEISLAHGPAQRPAGERHMVVLHVDSAALTDEDPAGCCEFEDGPALPAETARRLACDASLVTIVERNGRPLTVGRKTRAIPPALRRALYSRDHGCQFPGCDQRRFVDAHHIHHWAHGGETKLSNLLLLCRHHHRLIHEGGFRVERHPARGTVFRRPDGRPIPAVPRARRGTVDELRRRVRRAGLELHHETPAALSNGDRCDYGMAVEGLLHREGLLTLGWVGPPSDPSAEPPHVSAETPGADASPLSTETSPVPAYRTAEPAYATG